MRQLSSCMFAPGDDPDSNALKERYRRQHGGRAIDFLDPDGRKWSEDHGDYKWVWDGCSAVQGWVGGWVGGGAGWLR